MSYEVELKVKIDDYDSMEDALSRIGCVWEKTCRQADKIYYRPGRMEKKEEQTLFFRIRSENDKHILTLKQILDNTEVIEYESAVENRQDVENMLYLLGFEDYVTVIKTRKTGMADGITVCMDKVEELGSFMELEKVVALDEERESAREELRCFLNRLGVGMEQVCDKRYHTMMREYDAERKGANE
ncbi:MAG: class IV adenylate cyclase [Rikenellaceae bacterium]|nr:class IV adenylate cyclase [Rikenellaceae bacterium]